MSKMLFVIILAETYIRHLFFVVCVSVLASLVVSTSVLCPTIRNPNWLRGESYLLIRISNSSL